MSGQTPSLSDDRMEPVRAMVRFMRNTDTPAMQLLQIRASLRKLPVEAKDLTVRTVLQMLDGFLGDKCGRWEAQIKANPVMEVAEQIRTFWLTANDPMFPSAVNTQTLIEAIAECLYGALGYKADVFTHAIRRNRLRVSPPLPMDFYREVTSTVQACTHDGCLDIEEFIRVVFPSARDKPLAPEGEGG